MRPRSPPAVQRHRAVASESWQVRGLPQELRCLKKKLGIESRAPDRWPQERPQHDFAIVIFAVAIYMFYRMASAWAKPA